MAVLTSHVPTWVPGVTVALWAAKVTVLAATYACLLVYLTSWHHFPHVLLCSLSPSACYLGGLLI